MMDPTRFRKAEYLNEFNEWEEIPFIELRDGMKFRLFEGDGELAHKGQYLVAASDAYLNEEAIGTIQIQEVIYG